MHLLRSRRQGVAFGAGRHGGPSASLPSGQRGDILTAPAGRESQKTQPGGRMKSVRRWALASVGSAAAGVVMAAAAFACVSGPVVNLSTINAKAGQEVGITGTGFQTTNAAQIRWNALDGPLLTTVPAPIAGGNMD